jgi:hypothetical protein
MIIEASKTYIDDLVELGHMFFNETAFKAVTDWDSDLARNGFLGLMESPNASFVIYIKDGKVAGMAAGFVSDLWFSHDKMGQELFWYVMPKYRGKSGFKLLSNLECDLRKKGATIIDMVCLCDGMDFTKAYVNRGYFASEKHFLKRA